MEPNFLEQELRLAVFQELALVYVVGLGDGRQFVTFTTARKFRAANNRSRCHIEIEPAQDPPALS